MAVRALDHHIQAVMAAEGVLRLLSMAARTRGSLPVPDDLRDERADRLDHVTRLDLTGLAEHEHALIRLGVDRWLADGSTETLDRARDQAAEADAVIATNSVDTLLILDAVLRCEFDRAAELSDRVSRAVARTNLATLGHQALVARAIAAAHRGRRAEMTDLLSGLRHWGGADRHELPLVHGLARAFCCLLDDDADGARRELDAAARAAPIGNPTTHSLSGRYGLSLLLGVLAGDRDWADYHEVAHSAPARFRWNRHFVALARAVLLGREGRRGEAAQAMAEAADAGRLYPTARHLGLRLVAAAAHEGGWGEPVRWLRQAEDHFFRAGFPVLSNACRVLQRTMGAPLRQRRRGADRVPQAMRNAGVTAREYEVLELLANLSTNRDIAGKLQLSPRTVERHVANLLAKTGRSNRAGLRNYYFEFDLDP